MASQPIIQARGITKVYRGDGVETHALRGVDLVVEKGEFLALMGPSGSGKSTLLHIFGFLDRHTEGTYRFMGKSFDDYSDDEIAKVRNQTMGFVFQAFNLLPRTTVLDNVKLPLLYSTNKEKDWDGLARRVIRDVGLSHRMLHETSQLSGGEKQRVAIARALVNDPDIIFADEPTGNLDTKSGEQVIDILQGLNMKKGHTIVLITHETYTAEHAKRIVRLLDGRVESDKILPKSRRAIHGFKK